MGRQWNVLALALEFSVSFVLKKLNLSVLIVLLSSYVLFLAPINFDKLF